LTRADERLLQRHSAEIVSRLKPQVLVAELGSGSGKKTRWLLEALAQRQRTTYCPIEISPTALARCENELGRIECVSIVGFERPYLDGLLAAAARREENDHLLVLFLGSTIGNFDRDAAERFLTEVRRILFRGDALLLGTDLEKPLPQLLAAYDDSIGATAAFNLNLLARINRELGADFDLTAFRHQARYNATEQRVEMHLRSTRNQLVTIPRSGCAVSFLKDETIWTESSHKYRAADISAMARRNGFRCDSQWIDTEWPFAESLLVAE
jgi:dimethylhistidine N-methyltransferase